MVETAIYFLIGFLSAALLALMAAPAITRRAYRLAAARARLLAPLSEVQALADRDALRAQHSIEILKIEQRIVAAADTVARAKIDLGRRDAEIVALTDAGLESAVEIGRQRAEIRSLAAENRALEAGLGALQVGLHDLTAQRDRLRDQLAQGKTQITQLETNAEQARVVIATLETHNAGLEIALADRKRSSAEAARAAEEERSRLNSTLQASRHNATSLEERLADTVAQQQAMRGEAEGRAGEAARLRERLADMERTLARMERNRDDLGLQSGRQTARLAEREAGLERAEATRRDEAQRFNSRLEAASAREGALAERLRNLAASQATDDGALAAARIERIELKRELDALASRFAEFQATAQTLVKGDQILRQSIAKLGREIVRAQGDGSEDEPAALQIVNFARREPSTGAPADDHARERTLASEG